MGANVNVEIIPRTVTVTLTMDEEQALRVLGILGHGTGTNSAGDVYDARLEALEKAGVYTFDELIEASKNAHVFP